MPAKHPTITRRGRLDRMLALEGQYGSAINRRFELQCGGEATILRIVRAHRVADELLPEKQEPLLVPRGCQRLSFCRLCVGAGVDAVARLTTDNAGRCSRADVKQLLPNRQWHAFAAPAMERNLRHDIKGKTEETENVRMGRE